MLIALTLFPTVAGAFGGCEEEMSCCEKKEIPADTPSEDGCCLSLCFCSCCGTVVFFDMEKNESTEKKANSIYTSTFIYQSPIFVSYATDVFHPPKFA